MQEETYINVDYTRSITDKRTTSGYCTFIEVRKGILVTWRSKKQLVVAISSAEVENQAMTLGICELV